jgi:molybdopterin molybdotransferase
MPGLTERAALATAWAWIDAQSRAPEAETVRVADAAGRTLAAPVFSPEDLPDTDRAGLDGYAVRAADCDGAHPYNPLLLAPGAAHPVVAGQPLPNGADAVLPPDAAQPAGAMGLEVLAPVAPGSFVIRRAAAAAAGTMLLPGGRSLRPQDLACLAAIGHATVTVLARPRVRVVVAGPKSGGDALTPLLCALLARDGATPEPVAVSGDGVAALAAALAPTGGPVLLAGRSGAGPDDTAAEAVRAAGGSLALHGLALHPGETAGLGRLAPHAPLVLLPGEPFACLVAYDMLTRRLVRRLAGGHPAPAYREVRLKLERKISSAIGITEIVAVRRCGDRARPVGTAAGLAAALAADGFVVVAEGSEGYPAGAEVWVSLYGTEGA